MGVIKLKYLVLFNNERWWVERRCKYRSGCCQSVAAIPDNATVAEKETLRLTSHLSVYF